MKRSTLLVALMMVVAVLVPAAVASAADVAPDGGASTEPAHPLAQVWKAEMMAGYFAEDGYFAEGASAEDLMKLRTAEPAMGWGVLSKLVAYAVASDRDFVELLASAQDGGHSMGQIRKEYLEDRELVDLPYKNFGQMQKDQKPPKPGKADKKAPPGQA